MSGQGMAARSGWWSRGNMRGWVAPLALCALLASGGLKSGMPTPEGRPRGYGLGQGLSLTHV